MISISFISSISSSSIHRIEIRLSSQLSQPSLALRPAEAASEMPMPIAAKVGVIAVSVAVAAAVAIYESPELQRAANDLRRRIAIALHSFGDRITPQERENLFNRPEDAEGFLQSRRQGQGHRHGPGVEADDESLRRQREELMYWNSLREAKKKGDEGEKAHRSRASTSSSNFDDFLKEDANAEKGTFIFQTGHEAVNDEGMVRRRGADGLRGVNQSIYTNPFTDEHGIEDIITFENALMNPTKDEMSDIYNATDIGDNQPSRTMSPQQETTTPPATLSTLIEVAETTPKVSQPEAGAKQSQPQPALTSSERELGADEYVTAGQDQSDAYSSIQAWAQGASYDTSFYSPLPASPAPASEAEYLSRGELTPTDSASLAGSGVDVAGEIASTNDFDVMSEDSGMDTPTSWTDVESAAGDSESGAMHA